mgnify:CR=1 FL=1
MLAIEVNHKWDACPSKGSIQAPVHPHTKLSKYQTRIILTWWKLAWRYSHVSSGALYIIQEFVHACPLPQKGLGHLAALYLLYLLITRYYLSYHKTIYHLQFPCLQRKPYWKPLIISFCSTLGLTLLLIERTTIDPLYLWVIKTLFRRCCRGVKRLW